VQDDPRHLVLVFVLIDLADLYEIAKYARPAEKRIGDSARKERYLNFPNLARSVAMLEKMRSPNDAAAPKTFPIAQPWPSLV